MPKNLSFFTKGIKMTAYLSSFLKGTGRENRVNTMSNICSYYGVYTGSFRKFHKHKQSDFKSWSQLDHCESYICFEENIGTHLSVDEVALSKGELYDIITNKAGRGKKGSVV